MNTVRHPSSFCNPPDHMIAIAHEAAKRTGRTEYIRYSELCDSFWFRSPQNPNMVAADGERWFSVSECGVLEHVVNFGSGKKVVSEKACA